MYWLVSCLVVGENVRQPLFYVQPIFKFKCISSKGVYFNVVDAAEGNTGVITPTSATTYSMVRIAWREATREAGHLPYLLKVFWQFFAV